MTGTVTTKEAALAAGVTTTTIRSWVKRGALPVLHTWRRTNVYNLADVFAAEASARRADPSRRAQTRR